MDIRTYVSLDNKVTPYCILATLADHQIIVWNESNPVQAFLENLCKYAEGKEIEIYTHNINYDGLVVLEFAQFYNIPLDLFIRENNVYWVRIYYLKCQITIRCSYKILGLSINKIHKLLGFDETIFPFKFVNEFTLNYVGPVPVSNFFNSLEDYLAFSALNKEVNLKDLAIKSSIKNLAAIRSAIIEITTAISHFGGDPRLLKKAFSAPSLAYRMYINSYDNWGVKKNRNNVFEHNFLKNSYFGGGSVVFGNPVNDKLVHYFDFPGMYGKCMLEKFPVSKPVFLEKNSDLTKPGFHTVKVRVDDYLPFLPYKCGQLLFPNGEFTVCLWYEEILNALKKKKCQIITSYASLVYREEAYVFKEFIEHFSSIKNKGGLYRSFGKNMINGLYGSFALNDDDSLFVVCFSSTEFESYLSCVDVKSWKKVGNYYILNIKKSEKSQGILDKKKTWNLKCKNRNIAYASVIASKARIKINNALDDVIQDGGDLYYSDTDSIFAGYSSNKLGQSLGDITWSEVYEDAVFISSKLYFLKNESGSRNILDPNLGSFEEIKEKFYRNEFSFARSDNSFNSGDVLGSSFKTVNKNTIVNNYTKRVFSEDKKTTEPISVVQT